VSGERTPTPTVPSTAPPRSGSWSSLVDLVEGKPQLRYVFQCMCMHICQWFYQRRLQGLEADLTGGALCREDHSSGMLFSCLCMHICQWFHPRLQGLEAVFHWWSLQRIDHSSGTVFQCMCVQWCTNASCFIHGYKVWKLFWKFFIGGPSLWKEDHRSGMC
jgi:hypothetical protein